MRDEESYLCFRTNGIRKQIIYHLRESQKVSDCKIYLRFQSEGEGNVFGGVECIGVFIPHRSRVPEGSEVGFGDW